MNDGGHPAEPPSRGYGAGPSGGRVSGPATAEQMHGTALTILPPLNRMLLGFYETNINGHRVIAHGGDTN